MQFQLFQEFEMQKKKQKTKTKNPEENNNSKFIYIMSGIQMRKMSIQKTHKYYKLKI